MIMTVQDAPGVHNGDSWWVCGGSERQYQAEDIQTHLLYDDIFFKAI